MGTVLSRAVAAGALAVVLGPMAGCYQTVSVCEADCRDRECGPDPRCGLSCGSCGGGLICGDGVCRPGPDEEPMSPDGGDVTDPGADDGGMVEDASDPGADPGHDPCEDLPETPDCPVPSAPWNDQGPDGDGDGWGRCFGCDCDDTDPDVNPGAPEVAGDGRDNNCNGLIDEPGGDMVRLPGFSGKWIDKYETTVYADPTCTGTRYGEAGDDYPAGWPAQGAATVTLYACSQRDVVPSGHLSWHRARWACEAQGKRLCTCVEHSAGCRGQSTWKFPYSPNDLLPNKCNDALSGQGYTVAAGSYPDCVSPRSGAYDESGNLAEWLADAHLQRTANRMVGGFSWCCEFCWPDGTCHSCEDDPDAENNVYWLSDCNPDRQEIWADFEPGLVRPDFGTRCCYEE